MFVKYKYTGEIKTGKLKYVQSRLLHRHGVYIVVWNLTLDHGSGGCLGTLVG